MQIISAASHRRSKRRRAAGLFRNVWYVIHTVGPDARDQAPSHVYSAQAQQLASAYRASLACARDRGAQTVAFPAISVGIFQFPLELVAQARCGYGVRFVPLSSVFPLFPCCVAPPAFRRLNPQQLSAAPPRPPPSLPCGGWCPQQIAVETVVAEAYAGLEEIHFLFLNPYNPEQTPHALTVWRQAAEKAGRILLGAPHH
jgi:hypothetical protein